MNLDNKNKMKNVIFSKKGRELINMYEQMASKGYERQDNTKVTNAFSDFELRPYRDQVKSVFNDFNVKSTLDYGCGGSDWGVKGFDPETNKSAQDFFGLDDSYHYEPARGIDQRQGVDCVVSFDVLEHVFISDVPAVLRDMFQYANKLLVLNIACYPAAAKLPNGENAHITVRPEIWWKGMVDSISVEFPDVSILLICSSGWRKSNAFKLWKAQDWQNQEKFVVDE